MKKILVTLIVILMGSYGYTCEMSVQQNGVQKQQLATNGDTTLNFVGTGVTVSNSGSQSATVNLTGLQTTQGNTNATNITSLSSSLSTTNTNVSNLSTTVNNSVTTLNGLQSVSNSNVTQINVLNTALTQTNADVTTETTARVAGDSLLQTNITNETNRAITSETNLQTQINQTNQNVSNLGNRVDNLERFKVMPQAAIRVYDAKHLSMELFDLYDATNGRNFAGGMKVTLKLGKSYEERIIEKQQKQIDALQKVLTKIANQ